MDFLLEHATLRASAGIEHQSLYYLLKFNKIILLFALFVHPLKIVCTGW